MVFAVWAVRREVARSDPTRVRELSAALLAARTRYLRDPEGVVAAATRRYPFTASFIGSYLWQLRFSLGAAECMSLELFASLPALERRDGGRSAGPPDGARSPSRRTTTTHGRCTHTSPAASMGSLNRGRRSRRLAASIARVPDVSASCMWPSSTSGRSRSPARRW